MAGSGDIVAGRAGVQVYMDLDELKAGAKQADATMKQMSKNVSSMRAAMMVNSGAVGLQDFVTVLSQGGTMSTAIGAISNNLIQMATAFHPAAGAAAAVTIALGQGAVMAYKMWGGTKKTKEELEKARKEAEKLAEAKAKAARAAGEEGAKLGAMAGDKDALDKAAEDAKAKIKEKEAGQAAAQKHLDASKALPERNDQETAEKEATIKAAEEQLAEATKELAEARDRLANVERVASGRTDRQDRADANLERMKKAQAESLEARTGADIYETSEQKKIRQAIAQKNLDDAQREKDAADKDAYQKQQAALKAVAAKKDKDKASDGADPEADWEAERQAAADRIKKESMTPDQAAAKKREEVEQLQAEGRLKADDVTAALAQIERDRVKDNIAYQEELNPGKKAADDKAKSEAESLRSRYMSKREKRDRDLEEIQKNSTLTPEERQKYMNRAMAADQTLAGTFSGAALSGLGGGSALDAIQGATERTAKATEKIAGRKPSDEFFKK